MYSSSGIMARCFVTGGTGFIGSHIVRLLAQSGHEVHVLARKSSSLDLIDGIESNIVIGDVTDSSGMLEVIPDDVEWFFHNAAIMSDWGGKTRFQGVNVDGVRNVIEVINRRITQN